MSCIMCLFLLLSLSSCEYLLSPPAIAIEEEVAIEVLKEAEQFLEKEEVK